MSPSQKVLPNLTATELVDAAWDRLTEFYISDTRTARIGNQDSIQWKQKRIRENDALYRGDWSVVYPNETSKVDLPKVQNLMQGATDDLARLVKASKPDVFAPTRSEKAKDVTAGLVREAICRTYWMRNRCDQLRPWLSMDLSLTGACFLACVHPATKSGYPKAFRIDPRGAFPDVLNGELQDLIVLQRIRKRQAEALLGLDFTTENYFGNIGPGAYEDVEIIDYYHPMGLCRVITAVSNTEPIGSPFLYSKDRYNLDRVPVGFAMLPSGDGQFRGHFDQIKGIMGTQNRIATLMLDYADQGVYAPWEEYGISNPTEKPGPLTVYHKLDEKGSMSRVQPAISSPQLWQMMEFLEMQARAGAARPQSREGEVSQSIASGQFVNSTQGALTSMVQDDQSLLADVQAQWLAAAQQLDEQFGNVEKPLWRPVGNQYTYTPKKDVAGMYDVEVIYGAGAGLDYLNRKAVIEQELGAGLLSKHTARSQMDDIPDAEAEGVLIERELVEAAYLEKIVNSDDLTQLATIVKAMSDGKSLFEAQAMAIAEAQAALAAQQPTATPEAGGEAAAPTQPVSGAPPGPPGPNPPANAATPPFVPSQPLTNIQIGR